MKKSVFNSSLDGEKIVYYTWEISKPKAVFHIIHGSIEYALRYDEFAKHLNKAGFSVYMMDVRGHGETGKKKIFGHFADNSGATLVLTDVHNLNDIIKKKYKDKKIVLMGHSMGSFIARAYATKYKDIDLLIPCGTNHPPKALNWVLSTISSKKAKKNGDQPAHFLANLSYKAFDKKFKGQGDLAWLSKRVENRENYKASEFTKFKMTNKGFHDMSIWMKSFTTKNKVLNMDKAVPVLLINGSDDPVGNMGSDVKKAAKFYKKLGYNVSHIEYQDMRHEILNEDDRVKVYEDIINFVNTNIKE